MQYARVGIYTLSGPVDEVLRQASEGMLPIFKRQPGLVGYELVSAGDKLISISTWQTLEQANEGTQQVAAFVQDHATLMTLDHHYVGDVTLSSR